MIVLVILLGLAVVVAIALFLRFGAIPDFVRLLDTAGVFPQPGEPLAAATLITVGVLALPGVLAMSFSLIKTARPGSHVDSLLIGLGIGLAVLLAISTAGGKTTSGLTIWREVFETAGLDDALVRPFAASATIGVAATVLLTIVAAFHQAGATAARKKERTQAGANVVGGFVALLVVGGALVAWHAWVTP